MQTVTALGTALLQWCYFPETGTKTGADDDNRLQVDSFKKSKVKGKSKHPNQKGTRTSNTSNTDIKHLQELW